MPSTKPLAAAFLALAGLFGAMLESTLVHSDDGCTLETHCNACMLGLRSPVVVTDAFTLPRAAFVVVGVVTTPAPALADNAPRTLASRGPPHA
jgi:hypothetical protein